MSVTAWVSARKLCVGECAQTAVCPLSVCCQLSDWKLALSNQQQKALSQMFALCRYTAFLLNEAKPVVQRQSVNKRGDTKKDLSTHVSIASQEVWRKREIQREVGGSGCMERKSGTISREGKRSHTRRRYFFPLWRLLWFEEEFWLLPVWSLLQCDPVQMASSLSPLCLQHTAGTVTDAQHS